MTKLAEPKVMNVDEAAELLRISKSGAYAAIKAGLIPSVRIGRRILVTRAAVDRLLEGVAAPSEKAAA